MHQTTAKDKLGSDTIVQFDKWADYCPICNYPVHPIPVSSFLNGQGLASPYLQIVYRCPRNECGKTFFGLYEGEDERGTGQRFTYYQYKRVEPGYPKVPSIPDTIKQLSPSFCSIYQQACAADELGFKEICGAGYRKALEFLVKDFVKSKLSNEDPSKNSIDRMHLSDCIEKHIVDPITKEMAKRAAWLGNDETHYYRKWLDKDLDDLKKLLHLTINSIDNQLTAERYIEGMKD